MWRFRVLYKSIKYMLLIGWQARNFRTWDAVYALEILHYTISLVEKDVRKNDDHLGCQRNCKKIRIGLLHLRRYLDNTPTNSNLILNKLSKVYAYQVRDMLGMEQGDRKPRPKHIESLQIKLIKQAFQQEQDHYTTAMDIFKKHLPKLWD